MTKDEIKNRISMALQRPVLQQGFEIICRENDELEKENAQAKEIIEELYYIIPASMSDYAKEPLERAKKFLNKVK